MRFGWLLNLVSAPVLMAFTQAAAVLIVASQLPPMLGLPDDWSQHFMQPSPHLSAAAFGLASLLLLLLTRRWRPGFPAVLVLVLGAAGISAWSGFEAGGGAVVGLLPEGLPALYLPTFPGWPALRQLLLPTLVITLVSFLETASSAKVDAGRQGQRWDQDQDLIGQGMGKIAAGLSGAFPTSSSFSRSALNLYAGARTGWATVASVLVVLLALLFFTPVLRHVPRAALAAIVVAAVLGLLKPGEFLRLWRISRVEAVIAGLTFAVTLLATPLLYWGVLTGVLLSLSHFLYQRLHPRIIEIGLHADHSLRDRQRWQLPPLAPRLYGLRMDAALDFAAASDFERAIQEHLGAHPDTRHVCLFAQPVHRVDATGVEVFRKVAAQLRQQGIVLHISGMKLPAETTLRRAGELQPGDWLRMYRTDAEFLAALAALAELPADIAAAAI
jgi:SulP family sulfate permease